MTTPEISELQKCLTARRTALALQVDIPDMAAYALEWSKLGADFCAAGWVHNAEICYSNAKRYGAMDAGAYQRQLEEIPVKLVKTPEPEPGIRVLFCGLEAKYTRHVWVTTGWLCESEGCDHFVEQALFVRFEGANA